MGQDLLLWMARQLGDIYEGGKIMLVTGSPQQNIIMQLSGIPLINFYTADKFDTKPDSFPDVKYVNCLGVLIPIYTVLQKPGMTGLKQAF